MVEKQNKTKKPKQNQEENKTASRPITISKQTGTLTRTEATSWNIKKFTGLERKTNRFKKLFR